MTAALALEECLRHSALLLSQKRYRAAIRFLRQQIALVPARAVRRRQRLEIELMLFLAGHGDYAEALELARKNMAPSAVAPAARDDCRYELLCAELVRAECFDEARLLVRWLLGQVDHGYRPEQSLDFASACAGAWRRTPPDIRQVIAQHLEANLRRLGIARELLPRRGLHGQVRRAVALVREASHRHAQLILGPWPVDSGARRAFLRRCTEEEPVRWYRREARRYLRQCLGPDVSGRKQAAQKV